jgi:hypothetical protein
MADFRGFFGLARALQNRWHDRRMVRRPGSRRPEMSLSYASLHQIAFSIVGALLASSLFVSAAVGPVPVI